MKKNNRGFTLIELLAAVVILGILMVFALPVITRNLTDSRNKMYVSDAKRLISQAEYELKSSSSEIEKPKVGNCIIVSLNYLNATSIKTGPNGGTYDKDSSYVLIRAKENATTHLIEYDYSVALIEHIKKGGYVGVALARGDRLSVASVRSYKVADLVSAEDVTDTYIKQRLGDTYLSGGISKIYHYQEIKDSSVSRSKSSPVIKFIEVYSNDSNNRGSLNATLALNATDADTEKSRLTISVSLTGFDAADKETYSYGENNTFSKVIDFSNYQGHHYGYQDGASIILYVTVKDPDNNAATQSLSYTIHKNEAPVINSVSIESGTGINFHKVVGTISVYDDISEINTLQICFSQDRNATTCSGYKNYSDVVSNSHFYYTFKCSGRCVRDGSTNYLKVFIKDPYGAVSYMNQAIAYTFPVNASPTISNVRVSSREDSFPTTGNKSFIVELDATDDIPVEYLTVHVSNNGVNEQTYSYSSGGFYGYTINETYPYNGSTKNIRVYVTDEDNASSNIADVSYKLYQNQAPEISDFELVSRDVECIYNDACIGSLVADIALAANDDLDSASDLLVCLSESSTNCTNFQPYANIATEFVASNYYDGAERTFYATVKDKYGATSSKSTTYQVYEDQVPVAVGAPLVEAVPNHYQINLLDVYYYANMMDDLDEVLYYKICYKFGEGAVTCGNELSSSLGILHLNRDYFTNAPAQYAGQVVTLYAKVKDSYHSWSDAVETTPTTYTLFSDQPPEILSFDILFEGNTMTYVPGEIPMVYGDANAYFSVKDYTDEYQVAITQADNCTGVTYPSTFYDGSDSVTHSVVFTYSSPASDGFSFSLPVRICVKDKNGNVRTQTTTIVKQSDYEQCSMVDYTTAKYTYTVASGQQGITRDRCNAKCYAYNPFANETNNVVGYYKRRITYLDKFDSNVSCPQPLENYTANCSFKDCFVKNNQYVRAIGTVLYRADAEWTMEYGDLVYSGVYYYKVYQSSYNTGDPNITLTEIEGERVHPALAYNEDFMTNYVRIVDQYSE